MASTIRGKLVRTRPVMESLTPGSTPGHSRKSDPSHAPSSRPYPVGKSRFHRRCKLGSRTALPVRERPLPKSTLAPKNAHPTPPSLPVGEARLGHTSRDEPAPHRAAKDEEGRSRSIGRCESLALMKFTCRRLNGHRRLRWGESNSPSNSRPRILSERSLRFYFPGPQHCADSPLDRPVSEVSEPPH